MFYSARQEYVLLLVVVTSIFLSHLFDNFLLSIAIPHPDLPLSQQSVDGRLPAALSMWRAGQNLDPELAALPDPSHWNQGHLQARAGRAVVFYWRGGNHQDSSVQLQKDDCSIYGLLASTESFDSATGQRNRYYVKAKSIQPLTDDEANAAVDVKDNGAAAKDGN